MTSARRAGSGAWGRLEGSKDLSVQPADTVCCRFAFLAPSTRPLPLHAWHIRRQMADHHSPWSSSPGKPTETVSFSFLRLVLMRLFCQIRRDIIQHSNTQPGRILSPGSRREVTCGPSTLLKVPRFQSSINGIDVSLVMGGAASILGPSLDYGLRSPHLQLGSSYTGRLNSPRSMLTSTRNSLTPKGSKAGIRNT